MPRTKLTLAETTVLQELWDEGMTTGKRKDLIEKAVEETGLDEQTIMVRNKIIILTVCHFLVH